MFEEASRLKLRFDTAKGPLSVEDLWELPLTSARSISLDNIAVSLHQHMQNTGVSFVRNDSEPDRLTKLRFDIVKHIIDVRLAERAKADNDKAIADRKQKILEIIARKEDAALESAPIEELRKLIAGL